MADSLSALVGVKNRKKSTINTCNARICRKNWEPQLLTSKKSLRWNTGNKSKKYMQEKKNAVIVLSVCSKERYYISPLVGHSPHFMMTQKCTNNAPFVNHKPHTHTHTIHNSICTPVGDFNFLFANTNILLFY